MDRTKLLDKIKFPKDLREVSEDSLQAIADELRAETIDAVSATGGHLGAGLGVVELTVALHYVFNTPEDILIWDVGHQTYPHKILTGRRDKIRTLRQPGGLSGFTKRNESIYDPFGAAHSSTSISAALGMAVARDFEKKNHEVIAVIGDGAMSAGMAYEAMNNAGSMKTKLIVILNDNDMSIAPPTGAMSAYLSKLISSKSYFSLRNAAKQVASHLPQSIEQFLKKAEHTTRGVITGGNFFEEMGFYYIGPIDGHNLNHLLPVLKNVRDDKESRPFLIHVVTEKGHGFKSPEASKEKYHAVNKFDVATGIQKKASASAPTYTKVFAETLTKLAENDDKVIGITAAMPSGTGLDLFQKKFPNRMFDVGIAEQHAVTFAAGLAAQGFKPFAAIYSTFLQRAYDQVVHDVAIQSLPVRFAIDRAGLVGADGATHAGSYDITYLATLPNFVVMAPSDEAELVHMMATALSINDRPSSFRYPRGEGVGIALLEPRILEIGKGRIIKEGNRIALLSLGSRLHDSLEAAKILENEHGISCTVADARFAKPLDKDLIIKLVTNHEALIMIEEGAIGGFGSHAMQILSKEEILDRGYKVRSLCLPDHFIDQNTQKAQIEESGLGVSSIVKLCKTIIPKTLKNKRVA